jgi:hypothetical protein
MDSETPGGLGTGKEARGAESRPQGACMLGKCLGFKAPGARTEHGWEGIMWSIPRGRSPWIWPNRLGESWSSRGLDDLTSDGRSPAGSNPAKVRPRRQSQREEGQYFAFKSSAAFREAFSNAYPDKKLPSRMTMHRLVTRFWDRSRCAPQSWLARSQQRYSRRLSKQHE